MKKKDLFLLINILIILFSFFFIYFLGNSMNDKVLDYSKIEIEKITKYIINFAVNKNILYDDRSKNILLSTKDSEEQIKSIDFNIKEVNSLLFDISNNVLSMLKDFENGRSSVIDLSNNLITNSKIVGYKEGIILEVPTGVFANNFIFSAIGPKIPVKVSLSGTMSSYVSTAVVEYGINNAIITIYFNISVSMKVLLPFLTDKIVVDSSVPISMFLINGKIPNYYTSGMNSNSPILNLPTG